MRRRGWTLAMALAVVVGLYGCGGDGPLEPPGDDPPPPQPTPGWLNVELSTPNDDDGGIIFTLRGAPIDSVVSELDGFSRAVSDSVWRVLITGELSGGVIGRIRVPDVNTVDLLEGEVQQAAARTTYELRDLAGYGIDVVRPPETAAR